MRGCGRAGQKRRGGESERERGRGGFKRTRLVHKKKKSEETMQSKCKYDFYKFFKDLQIYLFKFFFKGGVGVTVVGNVCTVC